MQVNCINGCHYWQVGLYADQTVMLTVRGRVPRRLSYRFFHINICLSTVKPVFISRDTPIRVRATCE